MAGGVLAQQANEAKESRNAELHDMITTHIPSSTTCAMTNDSYPAALAAEPLPPHYLKSATNAWPSGVFARNHLLETVKDPTPSSVICQLLLSPLVNLTLICHSGDHDRASTGTRAQQSRSVQEHLDCPRVGPGQGRLIFADPDPDPSDPGPTLADPGQPFSTLRSNYF